MGGWLGDKLDDVGDFVSDPNVIISVAVAGFTGGLSYTATAGFAYSGFSVGSAIAAGSMIAAQRALTPSLNDGLGYSIDEMSRLGTQTQIRNPVAIREVVYGTVTKSGVLIALETTTNVKDADGNTEYSDTDGTLMLHNVIVLASHPIGALEEVYINNVNAILGYDMTTTPATKNIYYIDAGKGGLIAATDSTSNGTNTFSQLGAPSEDLSSLVEWKVSLGDQGNGYSDNPLDTGLYPSREPAQATEWRWDGGDNLWFPPRSIFSGNPDYAQANGLAILHVIIKYDANKFPQFPNIRATVRGRRVYDPRSSYEFKQPANSTAGERNNENPANCILDYLTDKHYGMGIPYSEIDLQSFITSANNCDVVISGSQSRYSCNGVITLDKTPKAIIEELLSCCAGRLLYTNGKFKLLVQTSIETATATINYDDIVSPITINSVNNLRDQFNQVRATFIQGSDSQVKDIDVVIDDQFLGEDLLEKKAISLSLPFVNSANEAKRLAEHALYTARKQIVVSFSCALNRFDIDIGDLVTLNLTKYGFEDKLFECVEWSLNTTSGNTVDLVFKEYTVQHFLTNPNESPAVITDIYYRGDTDKTLGSTGSLTLTSDHNISNFVNSYTNADYPKRLIFAENFELYRDSRTTCTSGGVYDLKPLLTIEDGLAGDFLHIHVIGELYGAHGGAGGDDWLLSSVSNFGGADGGEGGAVFEYLDTGNTPVSIINDGKIWAGGGGGGSGGRGGGFNYLGVDRLGTLGGDGKEGMGFNLKESSLVGTTDWADNPNNVGDLASTNTTTAGLGTTGIGGRGAKSGNWGKDGSTGATGSDATFSDGSTASNPPSGYTVIPPSQGNPGGKAGRIVTDSSGYIPSNVTIVNRGSMKGRIVNAVTGEEYIDT